MSFVDKVKVTLLAGDGGDGKLSFRHEKFINKGGPDGGDGGDGGDIILTASNSQNTLSNFRYQKELKSESGRPGGKTRMHGRSAPDLVVAVPVGTIAIDDEGHTVADLTSDGQMAIVAKGGKGGFGNAHFVSSRRQAPKFAEKGEPGQKIELSLELKLIADVGLVGLPNAGKSTLLSKLSNAKPEVADYPFTTLTPSLGVVDIDNKSSILIADIPGLIKGAADGKGLGHDFLRHIERTAVVLHLIDAYDTDPVKSYQTIRHELEAYDPKLAKRRELIALTKCENLGPKITNEIVSNISRVVPAKTEILAISALSGLGLNDLRYTLKALVDKVRAETKPTIKAPELTVLRLSDTSDAWTVTKVEGGFRISGQRIEQFARRTDFDNSEAVGRLRDIMQKTGINHELIRQGVNPSDVLQIGPATFKY